MRKRGRWEGRKGGEVDTSCITVDTYTHTHTHTHTRTHTHAHTHRDRMNRLLTHLERSEAMVAITQEEKEKLKDKVRHVIATFE